MKQHALPNYDYKGKSRIIELDFIRGFCLFLMIMDHTLYDLAFIFSRQWFGGETEPSGLLCQLCNFAEQFYFPWIMRDIVWSLVVFLFVFISGTSSYFSHSNLKRGIRLMAVALLLSAFTYGMDWMSGYTNQFVIRFGILHMLAASMLIYCVLRKTGILITLFTGVAAIAAGIYFTYVPLETSSQYLGILIRTTSGFYSADYFPLLPWLGFFLLGTTIGRKLYEDRRSLLNPRREPVLTRPVLFMGRHSLVVYLIHQPLVYGILTLLGRIVL